MPQERADGELTQDIHDALAFDAETNPANYTIAVGRGVVTISGAAISQRQKERVLNIVRSVPGIQGINEHIAVA